MKGNKMNDEIDSLKFTIEELQLELEENRSEQELLRSVERSLVKDIKKLEDRLDELHNG